jgi:hypothetical protein
MHCDVLSRAHVHVFLLKHHNIDKDIFRTMLQIAYRRLLIAKPGKAPHERVAGYSAYSCSRKGGGRAPEAMSECY